MRIAAPSPCGSIARKRHSGALADLGFILLRQDKSNHKCQTRTRHPEVLGANAPTLEGRRPLAISKLRQVADHPSRSARLLRLRKWHGHQTRGHLRMTDEGAWRISDAVVASPRNDTR